MNGINNEEKRTEIQRRKQTGVKKKKPSRNQYRSMLSQREVRLVSMKKWEVRLVIMKKWENVSETDQT